MRLARGYVGNADPLLLSVPRGSLGGAKTLKHPTLITTIPYVQDAHRGQGPRFASQSVTLLSTHAGPIWQG